MKVYVKEYIDYLQQKHSFVLNNFNTILSFSRAIIDKCDEYRKSYFPGKFVSNEFKKLYFDLIETEERDKKILFKKIEKFYTYVKDGRKLEKEFRLKIKSRNE